MSIKISDMTEATSLVSTDILPAIDISEVESGSRKITVANLINALSSNTITGTSFDSSDYINVTDSSTGNTTKITVENFINKISLATNTGTSTSFDLDDYITISDADTGVTIKVTIQDLMDGIINNATEVTSLDGDDKVYVQDGSGNFSSISVTNLNTSQQYDNISYTGWVKTPVAIIPAFKQLDSDGNFVNVGNWTQGTYYNVGDYITYLGASTYQYVCTKAGTSGSSLPAFNPNAWQDSVQEDAGGPWWASAFSTVGSTSTALGTIGVLVGTPLRIGAAVYMVKALSDVYVALDRAIPHTLSSLVYVGDKSKINCFDFNFPNTYTTTTSSEDLLDLYKRGFVWRGPSSVICEFSVENYTNDTTGTNYINIRSDFSSINYRNELKGVAVGTDWATSDATASPPALGILQYGDVIEIIKSTDGSTNQDAADLSVSMTVITL